MDTIGVDKLLEPIAGEDPCGPNAEYAPAFIELEQAAQGRPEQQVGDTVIPAAAPNWRDVATKATELLAETKDLRVAVHLCCAQLEVNGLVGLRDGLALLRGLLERYWDSVHPQLDADDDNDPTMRINVLAMLSAPLGVLAAVRLAPLVSVRGLGSYSLRDIQVATGELQAGDDDAPEMATIEAAFTAVELDTLRETALAARGASAHLAGIEASFDEHTSHGQRPDLSVLRSLLERAAKVVDERLVVREGNPDETSSAGAEPVDSDEASAGHDDPGHDNPGHGAPASSGAPRQAATAATRPVGSGEITTREQVIKALESICRYYDRQEPSSPIPILLRRARRLVHKDFIALVKDIAPDALKQIEELCGPGESDESEG